MAAEAAVGDGLRGIEAFGIQAAQDHHRAWNAPLEPGRWEDQGGHPGLEFRPAS